MRNQTFKNVGFFYFILALTLIITFCKPAFAEDPISRLFNPTVGRLKTQITYDGVYQPSEDLKKQDTDMSSFTNELSAMIPIWQNENNELGLGGWVSRKDIQTDALMPYSGKDFPSDFWDLGIGLHYKKRINEKWIAGGFGGVGSASDKPFSSQDCTAIRAAAMARYATSKTQAWHFYIFYSNIMHFWGGAPVPGIAWSYMPSKKLNLYLGFPAFVINYRPVEKFGMSFKYGYPQNAEIKFSYDLAKNVELFLKGVWENEGYFRHDRKYEKDRLFFFEKRALLGFNWELPQGFSILGEGGYAFDRIIFEGENYDDRDQNRIDLENGMLFKLQLRYRF